MKKKIHIVPHTHWDREWYFTTSRSKVYLMKDLKDVLDTLEQDQEFKYFMLDAQASLLDDYLKWMPQDEKRLKKLVKEKRLIIGPWYTQSDQLVISGESIVRNLYYGMKRCEELGGYMNIGYVPDSFGQSGNMPQIYKQFGIDDTLFWRGVSDDMVKHTDFNWRGSDGSVVYATQIPFGYYIGGNIPEGEKESAEFWQKECLEKAGARSATKHIYFPNGFDQAPIRKNLPQLIKERNEVDQENDYVISCIEDYIQDVKKENPILEEVNGELVIAKHMRIHKSIFSSRSDLKAMNTEIQNYITNVLEPLLTLSYHLGNDYPSKAVEDIWKLMFENAAHDSIGSCISDTANEDVYMRYKQARDMATNLVELHSRLIATHIQNKDTNLTLTVFNTLPYTRSEVVISKLFVPGCDFSLKDSKGNIVNYTILNQREITDYVLTQTINLNPSNTFYIPDSIYEVEIAIDAQDILAMGYKQLTLELNSSSHQELQQLNTLENNFYKITIEDDASLTILDKLNNYTYHNQVIFVENGDDGDSFNYSPPHNDLEVYSTDMKSTYSIKGNNLYQQATINIDMIIPKDLEERKQNQTSITMPLQLTVSLKHNSKVIDFKLHVNNQGLSHRLCVLFDADIATQFNYADQQFGSIKRPNYYEEEMKLYLEGLGHKKEAGDNEVVRLANWSNDQSTWQEPPISIEPTQSYVSLTDDTRGIAVYPKGVREYEIVGDDYNQIRLTLFRTYGYMGKENLIYRPGRASGERIIETPDAQLLKEMTYQFGFSTYQSSIDDANVDVLAKEYNTELQVYEYAPFLNGRLIFSQEEVQGTLIKEYSLFSTSNNLVVSSIKKAENNKGYIVRLYNGKSDKVLNDILNFNIPITKAYYTNLKEEKLKDIDIIDNTLTLNEISYCQFITLYFE